METQNDPDALEVSIHSFSPRGYGVGTLVRTAPLLPLEVEVAHTLPQDRVRLALRGKTKGVRKGRLLDILNASPTRVEPPCKHARVCGGCSWQQMAYPAQLREKEKRVFHAFGAKYPVQPILAAPQIYRYRNKMEFSFSENRGGMRYLGLMIAQAEPYVFNTEECHLCQPWVSEALEEIRLWWEQSGLKAYNARTDEGTLRYITLRESVHTQGKMAILNVSGQVEFAPTRSQLDSFIAALHKRFGEGISLFLRVHQTKKGRPTQFYEMHLAGPDHILEELHLQSGTFSFKVSPSSFFQPNTLQAERLYNAAIELLKPFKPSLVYDLYCGTGTFGMAISPFVQSVVGIELSPEAVLDAEENLKRNGIINCTFYQGDVGRILTNLPTNRVGLFPEAIIVDPPRAGLDPAALKHLKSLQAKVILYVSCNPLTQAENIHELLKEGYQLKTLQPVDQFPHTYHIENIALLVR